MILYPRPNFSYWRDRRWAGGLTLSLFLSLACTVSTVSAQDGGEFEDGGEESSSLDGLLQTSEGQLVVQGVVGPSLALDFGGVGAQFKFGAEGLYHILSGDSTGLAVGGGLHVSVIDVEVLQVFGRAAYDIEIFPGVLVSPHVDLGFMVLFGPFNDQTAFDVGFGADLRVDFNGFFALIRPVHIDIFALEGEALVRYDLLVGGGAAFL